jgi:SAM-dependent methyltransferase
MKKELLNIIKCPACSNSRKGCFNLIIEEADSLEIRKGKVICNICNREFGIEKGILDLIYNPDAEVLTEIEGNIKAAQEGTSIYNDEMLLLLPESAQSNNPADATYAYSLNFYEAMGELKITGDELVLDLGSGNTWSSRKFSQKGCQCVALDVSRVKFKGLESAEVYFNHEGIYYDRVVSDMKKLPFVDKSFDIVMSNSSTHHATNLKGTFKEINRVLKDNGKLALINEAVCSILSRKRDNRRKKLPDFIYRFGWTENTYSVTQYLRYLRVEGFSPKVLYPYSIDKSLSDMNKGGSSLRNKGIKHRLAYWVSFIWSNKFLRRVIKIIGFWPAMMLLGLPLVLVAEKKQPCKCFSSV